MKLDHRHYRPGAWLFALLLGFLPMGLNAAEAGDEPAPDARAANDAAPAPDADKAADAETADAGPAKVDPAQSKESAGAKPDQSPGVFIPSEEISEDFAVSFPVDI